MAKDGKIKSKLLAEGREFKTDKRIKIYESEDGIDVYFSDDGKNSSFCVHFGKNYIRYDSTNLSMLNSYIGKRNIGYSDSELYAYLQALYGSHFVMDGTIFSLFSWSAFYRNITTINMEDVIPMELPKQDITKNGIVLFECEGVEYLRFYELNLDDGVMETYRIVIDEAGKAECYSAFLTGWVKADGGKMYMDAVETNYLGVNDDRKMPKYYSHCKTSLQLVVSLLYKGWDNLIKLENNKEEKKAWFLADRMFCQFSGLTRLDDVCQKMFPCFDKDATSFAKMVGWSQYMVDMLLTLDDDSQNFFCFIMNLLAKELDGRTDRNYLRSTNEETFKDCMESMLQTIDLLALDNGSLFQNRVFSNEELIPGLLDIGGLNQWPAMLKYFVEVSAYNEGRIYGYYEDYIRMARAMGIHVWRLDFDKIREVHDEISALYSVMEDEKLDAENREAFEGYQNEWKKYEYSKDGLSVIVPKTPTDIIQEGLELSHCVKSYVEEVGKGFTTILFIRKTDEPEKPFFTLEIRNGRVRQCHGKCNRDMTAEVRRFLESFCIDKGIEMVGANCALAV